MSEARGLRFLESVPKVGLSRAGRSRVPRLRVGGASSASGSGRLFVFLIVSALFFCHGAFGYAHQLPPADVQTGHIAHAAGGHQPDPGQGVDGAHPGDAYFATLLAMFFGTFVLLGDRKPAITKLPASTVLRWDHPVGALLPSRGPTLPCLQVFRL